MGNPNSKNVGEYDEGVVCICEGRETEIKNHRLKFSRARIGRIAGLITRSTPRELQHQGAQCLATICSANAHTTPNHL